MTRPASKSTLDSIRDHRRKVEVIARDLTDGRSDGRVGEDEKAFGSQSAWLLGILASIAMVLGLVLLILALPPVLDCRSRSESGFFVGQTYGACVSSSISARWTLLEGRLKMAMRGSGR
ncbi:hypothetical protein [Methylobacterium sp. 77]|uniref:hypothetical protein n=1 Tax=Methylobacterium sp. 77 TaxID=1101192 RepID=UPI000376A968|nr:hypothetical protein [Methylobacterium sp. 77]